MNTSVFGRVLLFLLCILVVSPVVNGQDIQSFVARYREYRSVIGNDGREVNSTSMFEVSVHEGAMKTIREMRPGVISTTISDFATQKAVGYMKEDNDSLQKEIEYFADVFPVHAMPGDEVKVRFLDQQKLIGKDSCKLAIIRWREDDMFVWYRPERYIRPSKFQNSLFSSIPGIPVIISFKDKRIQLPMIAGVFIVYKLEAFSIPEHPEAAVAVKGVDKYPVVDDKMEYAVRFRKMLAAHPPDTRFNVSEIMEFLQYKLKEVGY
jgi:hypothetical protein